MSLLKKVNDAWQPSEKPNLKIGEVIEVTDYETLVKGGMAVLVDSNGNELELPGQIFTCPICFQETAGLIEFNDHVSSHLKSNKSNMEAKLEEVKKEEPKVGVNPNPEVEVLKEEVAKEVKKQNEEQKKAESKAKRVAALVAARKAKVEKATKRVVELAG